MSRAPSRRAVLLAAALVPLGVVSACSAGPGREEGVGPTDGTGPPPPPSPPPGAPDTALLLAVLQRTRRLLDQGAGLDAGRLRTEAGRTTQALQKQEAVLAQLLRAADVDPGPAASPAPDDSGASGSPEDAAGTTAPGADGTREWARSLAEEVTAEALTPLAGADAANLPLLVSLHARRGVAARELGATPDLRPGGTRTGSGLTPLVQALHPAVYAVELVASRASGAERDTLLTVLGRLRTLRSEVLVLVGAESGSPALGFGVEAPVDTRTARAELVGAVLAPLPTAVLTGTEDLTGDLEALRWTVATMTRVLLWGLDYGARPTALPGLAGP